MIDVSDSDQSSLASEALTPIEEERGSPNGVDCPVVPACRVVSRPRDTIKRDPLGISRGQSGSKPLILVADDEPDMRRFLVSQLTGIYNLQEARNGSEALSLAQQHDFSLILLDLMMPGIDGITLTRQLREHPRTAAVPIIILTARADEDSKMQALEAGVTDFLTKPFATSELAARCRNLQFQNQLQLSLSRKTRDLESRIGADQGDRSAVGTPGQNGISGVIKFRADA